MLGSAGLAEIAETEQIMAGTSPATVADVMRPPATTVDQNDHVAAAAYLMRHAGATALVVLDGQTTNRPIGLITEADIVHAVADGRDLNEVRILDLMTAGPTVVKKTTGIRDAAETMMAGHFRHLPVVDEAAGLTGIVDMRDICRALLELAPPGP